MFKKLLLITMISVVSTTAWAVTNPTVATLKIYGVALSANTDCSNATVVGYNADGVDYDFKTNPSIFSGAVAAGTYQCMILYMSSIINFKPLANDGANCVAGTSYHINVCNSDQNNCTYTGASPNASNVLVYDASLTTATTLAAATTGERVLLFLSTGSTGTGNDAFKQPVAASPTFGITLNGAFTVAAGGGSGTFVVNFDGKVDGSGSSCDLGPPVFSFR